MFTYRVLRSRPNTEKTGQVVYEDGQTLKVHRVIGWPVLGTVQASSERQALGIARERFGGRPVIESADAIHYL